MRLALSLVVALHFASGGALAAEQGGPDPDWEKHKKCGPWDGIEPPPGQIKFVLKAHKEWLRDFPDGTLTQPWRHSNSRSMTTPKK